MGSRPISNVAKPAGGATASAAVTVTVLDIASVVGSIVDGVESDVVGTTLVVSDSDARDGDDVGDNTSKGAVSDEMTKVEGSSMDRDSTDGSVTAGEGFRSESARRCESEGESGAAGNIGLLVSKSGFQE